MRNRVFYVVTLIVVALTLLAGCTTPSAAPAGNSTETELPRKLLSAGQKAEIVVNPGTSSAKKYVVGYNGDSFSATVAACASFQNGVCTWGEAKPANAALCDVAEYGKLDRCAKLPDGIKVTRDPTKENQKEYGVVDYPSGSQVTVK